MNPFSRIFMPQIVCGRGSLAFVKTLGKKKAAVFGFADHVRGIVEELFADTDTEVRYIATIDHEPLKKDLFDNIPKVQEFAPDLILAIGGGAVMDVAKGVRIFYEYPDMPYEDALKPFQLPPLGIKSTAVFVPTTSGTGSEGSSAAVFIDEKTRVKNLILSNGLIPEYAILDSSFTDTLPKSVQIATGLDALCHAIESTTTANTNAFVMAIAQQAALDIIDNLPVAVSDETGEEEKQKAKEKLHIAASLAGSAITNAFTGICHSYDHPGPAFDIPHGIVCGIMLPNSIRLIGGHPSYSCIAKRLGLTGTDAELAEGLAAFLQDLNTRLGVPNTFRELGIDEAAYLEKIPFWSEVSLQGLPTKMSPAGMDMEKSERFFKMCYYGE